jgi:hypothetical protein
MCRFLLLVSGHANAMLMLLLLLLLQSKATLGQNEMDGKFTAKALGLTLLEADKLRDEGKCFRCKKPGHHARVCTEVADTTLASWEMDVDVPNVAKRFYLR